MGQELAKVRRHFDRCEKADHGGGLRSDPRVLPGTAREILAAYRIGDPVILTARGVALGHVDRLSVAEEVRARVERRTEKLRDTLELDE